MSRWLLALTAGIGLSGTPTTAHHSLADYDTSRLATLDGVVADFQFVNPHPFIVLDVKDRSGAVQRWRVEMDNRHEMSDIGMTNETFKSGERLVVLGSPGHTQPAILYIRKLARPADGYGFEQVGSRPRLSNRPR